MTACFDPVGDVARVGRANAADLRIEDARLAFEHLRVVAGDGHLLVTLADPTAACRLERVAGPSLELTPGAVAQATPGDALLLTGEAEDPIRLVVRESPASEPPRILEERPLALLAAGRGAGPDDATLLRTLCALQERLGAAPDSAAVLETLADAALELVPRATHATVILRDERPGEGPALYVPMMTRVRGADGRGAPPPGPVQVARSVYRRVVEGRAAILAADAPSGELSTESLLGSAIRSIVAVPLWQAGEILGVLQVDNRALPGMFRSVDVDALGVLAGAASLAVANARHIDRLRVAEARLGDENRYLRARERSRAPASDTLLGESAALVELRRQIARVAATRVTVYIQGETGTGKELVARAVHAGSPRRDRLFVAQNCAALPEALLESELFGHRRGSFTGATEDRRGLFDLADGGTLFLDEIGEMPLTLQAKLLRALQEGEIRPVGAARAHHVDVRVVTATHRDLEAAVRAGAFREDLYYRLAVFPLHVPPLRDRRGDIPLLARHFAEQASCELGRSVAGIAQSTLLALSAHDWPGNVRELDSEMKRLVLAAPDGGILTDDLLGPRLRAPVAATDARGPAAGTLRERVEKVERHLVLEALAEHGGNKTRTARALGLTREGLHKKLGKLGLT
ncbi:MAG: sigma 54-interacting transcriptional regulator [Deltaproteobacteria bacterium]|nr:sigma 54-interacting transcriptional regulator [Deltaproteobacteria bacterium]